jgi:hypothetical protein
MGIGIGRRILPLLIAFIFLVIVALWPRPARGALVEPEYREATSCTDLAPGGVTWYEFKVTAPVTDIYGNGYISVAVTVYEATGGTLVDWNANQLIDAVYVAGGNGGNLYQYSPPGSAVTNDSGLHAPLNPSGQNYHDPEELFFCSTSPLDPTETPIPTPTEMPTNTPTSEPTNTPTSEPTNTPTSEPTNTPTSEPTNSPTPTATNLPTTTPTTTATATTIGTTPATATAPPPTAPPVTPTATATALPPPSGHSKFFPLLSKVTALGGEEPNDNCGDAYLIAPNYTHQFLPDDLNDWFTFILPAAGNLRIVVEQFAPLHGQIAAYRGESCTPGELQLLQNYGFPGLTKTLDLGQQPAGRYYLYVSNDGAFSQSEPYRLSITVE